MRAAGAGIDAERAISAWEEAHRPLLERFRQVQADLRAHKAIDLAMASVAMPTCVRMAAAKGTWKPGPTGIGSSGRSPPAEQSMKSMPIALSR